MGEVARGSFRRAPLTSRTMRFAAQVLSLALLPAMAAAQGSPQTGAAGDRGDRSESDTTAPRERDASRPARLLVVDCPAQRTTTATADRSDADSTTDALIAALCARAGQPASLGTVRHVLSIPRDVGNTPRDEHGDHADAPTRTCRGGGRAAVPRPPVRRREVLRHRLHPGAKRLRARPVRPVRAVAALRSAERAHRGHADGAPPQHLQRAARAAARHLLGERSIHRLGRPVPREHRLLQHRVSPRQLVPDRRGPPARLRARRRHRPAPHPHPGRGDHRRHPLGWAGPPLRRGAGQRPRRAVVGRDGAAASARRQQHAVR